MLTVQQTEIKWSANPIYSACPAKPSCMGRSREPACTERGRSVEPSKPILISKRIVEYKQNAYFTFARDGVYFSQYAITNRKKRLVTFERSQASRSHVFGRMKRSYNCSRYSICGNEPADVLGGLSFLLQGRTPNNLRVRGLNDPPSPEAMAVKF